MFFGIPRSAHLVLFVKSFSTWSNKIRKWLFAFFNADFPGLLLPAVVLGMLASSSSSSMKMLILKSGLTWFFLAKSFCIRCRLMDHFCRFIRKHFPSSWNVIRLLLLLLLLKIRCVTCVFKRTHVNLSQCFSRQNTKLCASSPSQKLAAKKIRGLSRDIIMLLHRWSGRPRNVCCAVAY